MGEAKRRKQHSSSYGKDNALPRELKVDQIRWAWAKCVAEKPQAALMEGIPLMCAEVMQTDEIGLVTTGRRQVTIVRHLKKRPPKGAFEILASQDFDNISWAHLFEFLKMPSANTPSASIVSGFELLLYQPKNGQLYTPLKYSGYSEAVKGCDRHLFFLLNVIYAPSMGSIVCIAQVDALVLRAVFEKKIKVSETAIIQVVEDWTGTVYSDELAEQRYKALSNFPLAEPPADSDDQLPIIKIQLNDASW